MGNYSHNAIKGSYILGKQVLNSENDRLGKIEDIVLDKKSGQVLYVVLSFDTFMGLGDQLYALPWSAIDFDMIEQGFRLVLKKDEIAVTTSFKTADWLEFKHSIFHQTLIPQQS